MDDPDAIALSVMTERLCLRPFRAADDADFHRLCTDPEVVRWIAPGAPLTGPQIAERLAVMVDHWPRHGFGVWAMHERATGHFVGRCGLRHGDGLDGVELVYTILPEFWNRGYTTEGARAALHHGFWVWNLPRIVSYTLPHNQASRRVMEKVGLCFEQTGPHAGLPHVWYGLSRDQYLSEHAP